MALAWTSRNSSVRCSSSDTKVRTHTTLNHWIRAARCCYYNCCCFLDRTHTTYSPYTVVVVVIVTLCVYHWIESNPCSNVNELAVAVCDNKNFQPKITRQNIILSCADDECVRLLLHIFYTSFNWLADCLAFVRSFVRTSHTHTTIVIIKNALKSKLI